MIEEDIRALINYRSEKAHATINEVSTHISNNFYSTAMNRIYYAGFYIVNALALFDDFSTSKYSQLIGWFNR